MSRLIVPPLDKEPWPTLGPEICDWIEAELCHGPGDISGDPVTLTNEERLFLYRVYEVYPKGSELEGRRRFKRAVYSRRKGARKTEFAAWVAIAETHPQAPVRADGFRKVGGDWVPVGRGVVGPYIPMVAYTREQLEDLAFNTVLEILGHVPLGNDFDLNLEQISLIRSKGKIQPRASAPGARDGARTSFQHFDETHRMLSPRLRQAHQTMLRNIPKRYAADAWTLETTTMYGPGEASIAEGSHRYALDIVAGKIPDPSLYFDHRQAAETHNLQTKKGRKAAFDESSGDATWSDFHAAEAEWHDPQMGEPGWRRFWLNQPWASEDQWLPAGAWQKQLSSDTEIPEGDEIVVGFWGEASRTSAGMIGCTRDGHLFSIGSWDHSGTRRRVTRTEVSDALNRAIDTWRVAEIVSSIQGGSGWISEVQEWAERGLEVVELPINSAARMGPACTRFRTAVEEGDLTHDGHPILERHIRNATPATSNFGEFIRPGPGGPISNARAAVMAYERAMASGGEDDLMFMVFDPAGDST